MHPEFDPQVSTEQAFPALHSDPQGIRLISHQFRTPLTAIMGYAELLLDRSIDRRTTREFADSILVQASRLGRVIDGLLALSQLNASGESDPVSCAMDVLVEDVVNATRQKARNRTFTVALAGAGTVTIDPSHAQRMVDHLLANAAAFSPESEPVGITSSSGDGWWTLTVADRGAGIPASMRQRVFDRFVRVGAPATASREGAGLGLAIVRETARHYGGDAWASENPGGGALLSVRIPLETAQFRALRHDAA